MDFLDRLELWSKNEKDFLNNFRFDPYFIAEIGVNHEGSIEEAKKLIRSAKENGANAVKFQSYKAEKLTIKNSPAYWINQKNQQIHNLNYLTNMTHLILRIILI